MANVDLKTYAADLVTLSVAGQVIDSGFDEGEFVSVEPSAEAWLDKAGADGEVARSRTNDRRATVKIKVMQTSRGNGVLQALYNNGLNTPNGADVGAFLLSDRSSGETLVTAAKCWVQKMPNLSRGKEVGVNEWTLRLASAVYGAAGSPST